MRNFARSLITALLCVLFLMVGGCAEEPTSPEQGPLSNAESSPMNSIEGAEGVEDQEAIPVVREEEAPIHEDPPRDDTVPDMPEITVTELGKSFTISLVSNPTTGYSWQAHFDPEYLELINNDFVNNSNLIGAPGVESFELKAIKQGQTELRMIYKRSWEDHFAEKRVILVQITRNML